MTFLLLALSASTSASASPILAADVDQATHDRLMADFRLETSLAHDAAADSDVHPYCLTTLMLRLEQSWSTFSPSERAEITAVLAPWKRDLFDALPVRSPVGSVSASPPTALPPPAGATDSCVGQQMDNRLAGTNFVVEWDNGTIDEATAQRFLDALDYAYPVEVDELGWNPPAGAGRYLMPAYVTNQNYAGAYTTVQNCGGVYTPYIVAGRGSFSSGSWYETMALHEFNHALQFNTAYAPEFYWWEATATFIEEEVLPDNNYWSTYIVGYSYFPYLAMDAFSQSEKEVFYHMYGMSIFGFYLREYQGGDDIVRQTWAFAAGERGQYSLSMNDMLTGIGIDWDTAYADFLAKNVVMAYPEQRYYTPVEYEDSVSSLPADGSASRSTRPQGYGQNFIKFKDNAGDGESTLVIHFHGDPEAKWLAQLVEVDGNDILRVVVGEIIDGEGDVSLETFGANDVTLVVSPIEQPDASAMSSGNYPDYDYSWEAELVAAEPTGGDDTAIAVDDTAADAGGDADDPEKFSLPGCGCAASEPDPTGLAMGLALVAVGLVRRRR